MNRSRIRRTAGFVLAGLLAAMMVAPVALAESFMIDIEEQIVFGEPGNRYDFGTYNTPVDLVGYTCDVAAVGNNNQSVHPGNNLEVSSVNTVTLFGVEDSQDKTTPADGPLELAETISVTLVLGQDPVFSADLHLTFDCEAPATTTTTEATTTTTEATTTTTEATTTTTEATTTTTEPESTTTTDPETTTTTTPEVASTTTTPPEVSSTTLQSTSTTDETPDTLPFTGVGSGEMGMMAVAALAMGGGLIYLSQRGEGATD